MVFASPRVSADADPRLTADHAGWIRFQAFVWPATILTIGVYSAVADVCLD
jgi:hypothetical protein